MSVVCLNKNTREYKSWENAEIPVEEIYSEYVLNNYVLPEYSKDIQRAHTLPEIKALINKYDAFKEMGIKDISQLHFAPVEAVGAFFKDVLYFGEKANKKTISEETFHALMQRYVDAPIHNVLLDAGKSLLEARLKKEGRTLESYLKSIQKELRVSPELSEKYAYEEEIAKDYVTYDTTGNFAQDLRNIENITDKLSFLGQAANSVARVWYGLIKALKKLFSNPSELEYALLHIQSLRNNSIAQHARGYNRPSYVYIPRENGNEGVNPIQYQKLINNVAATYKDRGYNDLFEENLQTIFDDFYDFYEDLAFENPKDISYADLRDAAAGYNMGEVTFDEDGNKVESIKSQVIDDVIFALKVLGVKINKVDNRPVTLENEELEELEDEQGGNRSYDQTANQIDTESLSLGLKNIILSATTKVPLANGNTLSIAPNVAHIYSGMVRYASKGLTATERFQRMVKFSTIKNNESTKLLIQDYYLSQFPDSATYDDNTISSVNEWIEVITSPTFDFAKITVLDPKLGKELITLVKGLELVTRNMKTLELSLIENELVFNFFDTNSNGAERRLQNEFANKLNFVLNTKFSNKENFTAFYNKIEDISNHQEVFLKLLEEANIDVTPTVEEMVLKNTFGGKPIAKIWEKLSNREKTGKLLFSGGEERDGELNSVLRKFIKIQIEHNETIIENSFTNLEGKRLYAFQRQTPIISTLRNMVSDEFLDKLSNGTAYLGQENIFTASTMMNPVVEAFKSLRKSDREEVANTFSLDGSYLKGDNRQEVPFSEMDDRVFSSSLVNLMVKGIKVVGDTSFIPITMGQNEASSLIDFNYVPLLDEKGKRASIISLIEQEKNRRDKVKEFVEQYVNQPEIASRIVNNSIKLSYGDLKATGVDMYQGFMDGEYSLIPTTNADGSITYNVDTILSKQKAFQISNNLKDIIFKEELDNYDIEEVEKRIDDIMEKQVEYLRKIEASELIDSNLLINSRIKGANAGLARLAMIEEIVFDLLDGKVSINELRKIPLSSLINQIQKRTDLNSVEVEALSELINYNTSFTEAIKENNPTLSEKELKDLQYKLSISEILKDNNIKEVLKQFWIGSSFTNQILVGDPMISFKNDFRDILKRHRSYNAAILGVDTPFAVPSLGIKPKNEVTFIMTNERIENGYDTDDAQSYSSMNFWLHKKFTKGRLGVKEFNFFKKVQAGEEITNKEAESANAYFASDKTIAAEGNTVIKHSEHHITPRSVASIIKSDIVEATNAGYVFNENGLLEIVKGTEVQEIFVGYVDEKGNAVINKLKPFPHREYLFNLYSTLNGYVKTADGYRFNAPIDLKTVTSAAKAGKKNVLDVNNFHDEFSSNPEYYIQKISASKVGDQVENPQGKRYSIDPSQNQEIKINEIEKAKGIISDYMKNQANRNNFEINLAIKELYGNININTDELNFEAEQFIEGLVNVLKDSGTDNQKLDFFKVKKIGEEFVSEYNLNLPPIRQKFTQSLFKIFSKALKHKVAGDSQVQVSKAGYDLIKRYVLKKDVLVTLPDGKKIKKDIGTWEVVSLEDYEKDANRFDAKLAKNLEYNGTKSVEGLDNPLMDELDKIQRSNEGKNIYYFDEVRFMKPHINENNELDFFVSETIMPKWYDESSHIPNEFKYQYGVRIPSQDKQSSVAIEWVESWGPEMGNSIIVPKEIIALSGSDFDIDKLFTQRIETYVKNNKIYEYKNNFEDFSHYMFEKKPFLKGLFKSHNLQDKIKEQNKIISEGIAERKDTEASQEFIDKINTKIKNARREKDRLEEFIKKEILSKYGYPTNQKEYTLSKIEYPAVINNKQLRNSIKLLSEPEIIYANSGADKSIYESPATVEPFKKIFENFVVEAPANSPRARELRAKGFHETKVGDIIQFRPYKDRATEKSIFLKEEQNNLTFSLMNFSLYQQGTQAARAGIGLLANANVLGIYSNRQGIKLSELGAITFEGKILTEFSFKSLKERRVYDAISSVISATTDEAKESQLANHGIVLSDLKVMSVLLLHGVDLEDAYATTQTEGAKKHKKITGVQKLSLSNNYESADAKVVKYLNGYSSEGQNILLAELVGVSSLSQQDLEKKYFAIYNKHLNLYYELSKILPAVKMKTGIANNTTDFKDALKRIYDYSSPKKFLYYDVWSTLDSPELSHANRIYSKINKVMSTELVEMSPMYSGIVNILQDAVSRKRYLHKKNILKHLDQFMLGQFGRKNIEVNKLFSNTEELEKDMLNSISFIHSSRDINTFKDASEHINRLIRVKNDTIVLAYEGKLSDELKSSISNSWLALKLSPEPQVSKLADDLFKYYFVKDGLNFGQGSLEAMFPAINFKEISKVYDDIIDLGKPKKRTDEEVIANTRTSKNLMGKFLIYYAGLESTREHFKDYQNFSEFVAIERGESIIDIFDFTKSKKLKNADGKEYYDKIKVKEEGRAPLIFRYNDTMYVYKDSSYHPVINKVSDSKFSTFLNLNNELENTYEQIFGKDTFIDPSVIDATYKEENDAIYTAYEDVSSTPSGPIKQLEASASLASNSSAPTITNQSPINIFSNIGDYSELSNFAERHFVVDGRPYSNVESAFQHAKIAYASPITEQPKAVQTANWAELSGSDAKALGRKIVGLRKEEWDANSSSVMKTLLRQSFEQNPEDLKKLLQTGDAVLTHINPKYKEDKWTKEFPKLLMEVRNETSLDTKNVKEVAPGIKIIENAITPEEELELFNELKPYLESQASRTNIGKNAPLMIGLGLRWDYTSNNVGKTPVELGTTINNSAHQKNKYRYYDVAHNGQPLGKISDRLKELMTKATGIDATDYDGAIINIYPKNGFISAHNDVDESVTAINYPVLVQNIGGDGNLSIEGAESQKAKKGYNDKIYTNENFKSGDAYVFGENGVNRDIFHRTLPSSGLGTLPELNVQGEKISANSYRITITLRRVKPLTKDMPIKPKSTATESPVAAQGQTEVREELSKPALSVELFEGFWTREEVAKQTDKIFLFGDNTDDRLNTKYIPSATQAVIRGLPNAIGIDTKKNRKSNEDSYFSDGDFEAFKQQVDEAIEQAKISGKTIVIPADGIGTGKAMLAEKAPKLYEYLVQELNKLKNPLKNFSQLEKVEDPVFSDPSISNAPLAPETEETFQEEPEKIEELGTIDDGYLYYGGTYSIRVVDGVGVEVLNHSGSTKDKNKLLAQYNSNPDVNPQNGKQFRNFPPTAIIEDFEKVLDDRYELFPGVFANKQQREAIDSLENFLAGKEKVHGQGTYATLTGLGGTGKTTIIKKVTQGKKVLFLAPTHKAAGVLQNSTGKKAFTVAKATGIRPNETGKFEVLEDNPNKLLLPKYQIIVIDEASMLDDNTLTRIDGLISNGAKVIFMGDKHQLPPVGQEKDSEVFDFVIAELTERMRQGEESPIVPITDIVANNVRKEESAARRPIVSRETKFNTETNEGVIFESSLKEGLDMWKEDYVTNPTSTKIITYNNENNDNRLSVKTLNAYVRTLIHGVSTDENIVEDFIVGEQLTAYNTYGAEDGQDALITNSSDYTVARVSAKIKRTHTVSAYSFQKGARKHSIIIEGYEVSLIDNITKEESQVFLPTRESANFIRKEVSKLYTTDRQLAYLFSESYPRMEYGYVITSHKAQGSTYRNAYVMEDNILGQTNGSTKQLSQSLYVAVSRPSHKLVLLSAVKDNSIQSTPTSAFNKVGITNVIDKVDFKNLKNLSGHISDATGILINNTETLTSAISETFKNILEATPALTSTYTNAYVELANTLVAESGQLPYTVTYNNAMENFDIKKNKVEESVEIPFDVISEYNNNPEIWGISENTQQFYSFIKGKEFANKEELIKQYKKYIETLELNGREAVNLPCV